MERTENTINPVHQNQETESDFKLMRYLFSKNKWTLLLFILSGLAAGVIYYNLMPERYLLSATLLIREENKSPELKNVFRQLNVQKKTNDIEDQIGLLKSYRLNLMTLEKFNWSYKWSRYSWLKTTDLFPNEPFGLTGFEEKEQIPGVPLVITVVSDTSYRIQCNKTIKVLSTKQQVTYDQVVTFGQPFSNPHFSFILTKRSGAAPQHGEKFLLEFTDPQEQANAYKENLVAVRFNPLAESNLISLKLETYGPQRDVLYLNSLMEVFLEYGIEEKNKAAENTIRFIDGQISGVNQSLESAGTTFTNFRTSNRTVNLDLEASTMVEKQNLVESELTQLDNRLDYYMDLKYYLENKSEQSNLVAPSITTFTDDLLKSKVERVNDLFSRKQMLSLTAREKNPALITLDNEIRFTQKMLLENINGLIVHAETEKKNLIRRQKEINRAIARLPVTETNMIGMKRNFDLNNELYTFLLERRAEAEITKASNDAHAQILDPASEGTAMLQSPLLGFNLLMGSLVGFILGLSFILFNYFASDTLTDTEEINSRLEISPIGSIPLSRIKNEWTSLLSHPRSSLAESFRGIRMSLSTLLDKQDGKVIAVHAFLPGSGKSFVSLNLAQAFSVPQKKILLIDADLQRPILHRMLRFPQGPGLSDYLSGKTKKEDLISKTDNAQIDFISSGSFKQALLESSEKEKFDALLSVVKKEYDVIIIDNSPFGLVNDPRVVGSQADINLFLLRLNHSKRSEIQQLNSLGARGVLKGIVVAINGKEADQSYGYYLEPQEPWKEYLGKVLKPLTQRALLSLRFIRPNFNSPVMNSSQKFFHDKN